MYLTNKPFFLSCAPPHFLFHATPLVTGEGLLKEAMEGRMEVKRANGRRKIGMIDELTEDCMRNEEKSGGSKGVVKLGVKDLPSVRTPIIE